MDEYFLSGTSCSCIRLSPQWLRHKFGDQGTVKLSEDLLKMQSLSTTHLRQIAGVK